jgi:hypothetical protein
MRVNMDAVRAVTRVVVHGAITSVVVLRAIRDELRANVLAGPPMRPIRGPISDESLSSVNRTTSGRH